MKTNAPRSESSRPAASIAPAATALAVLAGAGSAAAQVVFFPAPTGNSIDATQTLYIDIDRSFNSAGVSTTDSTGSEFSFTFGSGDPGHPLISGPSSNDEVVSSTKPYVDRLSYNTLIGPGSAFAIAPPPGKPLAYGTNGQWAGGSSGYIGFTFIPSSTPLYGWMDVTYDPTGGGMLTVNGWAYNTDGNPVRAGSLAAIPEPTTTAALMGAAVLAGSAVMMRRRRQKLAPAAA